MMKGQLKDIIAPMLITLLILIVLEIFSTAILPLFGLIKYRIPFNILVVLYLGFKLDTPYIALLIFISQYFHSFFSVEGWEMGTVAGVLICIIISYLRDLIHFNSAIITTIVTQLFQVQWFLIVSIFIYIRTDNFDQIVEKFYRFIPESIVISLLAPIFFVVFDRIWSTSFDSSLGDEI